MEINRSVQKEKSLNIIPTHIKESFQIIWLYISQSEQEK